MPTCHMPQYTRTLPPTAKSRHGFAKQGDATQATRLGHLAGRFQPLQV
jgi:hypothetical protein